MALAQAYDVICLDRNMPGLDGPSAARGLRGQAFLVACTSQPEGLEDQFEAVLAKPVSCGAVADVPRTDLAGKQGCGRERHPFSGVRSGLAILPTHYEDTPLHDCVRSR